MAIWSYVATRMHGDGTETVIATDLPLSEARLTENLSAPQELSGTLSPEITRWANRDGSIFVPWSTCIWALLDGRPRIGGIVTQAPPSNWQLRVQAVGLSGFVAGMPWTDPDFITPGAPASQLLEWVWAKVQAHRDGNLGLDVTATPTPKRLVGTKKEPLRLTSTDTHDLATTLDDIARVGMHEWEETHGLAADGTLTHQLTYASPRLGRRRHDLRFAVGENVTDDLQIVVDAADYASEILALGAGEGSKMLRTTRIASDTGRLRRVVVRQHKAVTTSATLDALAAAALQDMSSPPGGVTTLTVMDHPAARIGSWRPGDEIMVTGFAGWAGDVGQWVRVLSTTIDPAANTATLDVARADKVQPTA